MDWDAWARRAEQAIDMRSGGDWKGLFAPGATFADPANAATDDLRDISRQTRVVFPDWSQEITSIRGGDDWAVFEWIGRFGDEYRGKEDYVAFIADLLPTLQHYTMSIERIVYSADGRVAFAELSETLDVDGAPLRTPEALVFDLTEDGLIRHISIY